MAKLLYINSSVRHSGSLSRQLSSEYVAKWKAAHPSGGVIEREGLLRDYGFWKDRFWDQLLYARTARP